MVHEMTVQTRPRSRVPLERLYLEHEPRVRWIMHARGVPDALVDDLVHEAFLAISRRWATRDEDLPISVWIGGVARNVAFSHRRAEARRRIGLSALPESPASAGPDDVVAARDAWQQLELFARGLSPKLREVFVLVEVGGAPVPEIAAQSGVPISTVHSRLRLARRRFEAYFGSERTASARRELLRTAAAQRNTSESARRRALAGLVAAIPEVSTAASVGSVASGVAGSTLWGGVAVAVAAVVVAMVAIERALPPAEDPPVDRAALAPIESRTRANARAPNRPDAAPQPAAAPVGISADREGPPDRATRSPGVPVRSPGSTLERSRPAESPPPVDAPAVSVDPLATHVAALAAARSSLQRSEHAQALAKLDAVEPRAPGLERDHQRLVLRAACGAKSQRRIEAAHAALRRLGASEGTDPCGAKKKDDSK